MELESPSRFVLGVEIGWTKANTKVSLDYTDCWNRPICKIHLGSKQNLAISGMLGDMQTRKSYEDTGRGKQLISHIFSLLA